MLDISYSDSNRVHAQLDNTGFFFLVWTRTGFICFFTAKGFCAAGVGEIWCLETGSESSRRHTFKLIKRAYGRESTACNARMLIYWKYTPPLLNSLASILSSTPGLSEGVLGYSGSHLRSTTSHIQQLWGECSPPVPQKFGVQPLIWNIALSCSGPFLFFWKQQSFRHTYPKLYMVS